MAILSGRRKEGFIGHGANALAKISFVNSLGVSALTTIWALYIYSFVGNDSTTGIVSGILTLVSFISFFAFVPIVEKYDSRRLFSISLFMSFVFYLLFALNIQLRSFYVFMVIAILYTASGTIRVAASGVILQNNSKRKDLSKNEGFMYTLLNLGWVIGPLFAGWISAKYGNIWIFLLAALFAIISWSLFKTDKFKEEKKTDARDNVFSSFINFFKSKDRIIAYFVGGGITAWWVLIYVFIPLMMTRQGFGTEYVGYFLFAMAIPLILLEYYFGKMAGKFGYRGIFQIGTFVVAAMTIMCVFTNDIYVIFGLMILGSVGMAMLEPTTEAYFLYVTKKKDAGRFFGPYNTSRDVNQFIAKIIPSFLLLVLPFKSVFVFFSVFMLGIFFVSFFVKRK